MPALDRLAGLELPLYDGYAYWNTRVVGAVYDISQLPPVPELDRRADAIVAHGPGCSDPDPDNMAGVRRKPVKLNLIGTRRCATLRCGMTTRRERRARRALKTLGTDRFVTFLRAVQGSARCYAVTLFLGQLALGLTVDAILFDGEALGYSLDVETLEPARFRIQFGCQPGEMVGDGGTWDVAFDADGAVIDVTTEGLSTS